MASISSLPTYIHYLHYAVSITVCLLYFRPVLVATDGVSRRIECKPPGLPIMPHAQHRLGTVNVVYVVFIVSDLWRRRASPFRVLFYDVAISRIRDVGRMVGWAGAGRLEAAGSDPQRILIVADSRRGPGGACAWGLSHPSRPIGWEGVNMTIDMHSLTGVLPVPGIVNYL